MAGRIEDYAMIGDMRTAALICRNGSIDWLCLPRFDSGACFAALLGKPENGRWLIAPSGKCAVRRRYRKDSLILETTFSTKSGKVSLIDFMPVESENCSVVRLVVGRKGSVRMKTDLVIRFDYGISVPWVNRRDDVTVTAIAGPNMLVLHTPVPVRGKDMRTQARFTVKEGQTIPFVLTHSPSHLPPPAPMDVSAALESTRKFWTGWSGRCRYEGDWKSQVRRSLIILKALSYRPTGGIVAAVTTSLPEQIGGPRNWDYRYCWLRDATFTLLAFLNAGYKEEAIAWQNWLLRSVAGSPDQIQTMYGVAGERRLDEWEIDWLPGYENSRPVRVGNAAALQLQLDIYGELAGVISQGRQGGLPAPPRQREIRGIFLEHLEKTWLEPDEGIWEIRGPPQHFVHSKAMAWAAFDRAAKDPAAPKAKRKHWQRVANAIHAHVCLHGTDPEKGCFVQSYGSERMDASLLQLPIVGFLPPSDSRIQKTVAEIEKRLMWDGLLLRYETESGVDGLPAGEGAFLACSFWLVNYYVLSGHRRKALALFRRLAGYANDLGLFAEEYDPRSRRMLGNFPQAFSHVALVNSALNLARRVPLRLNRANAKHRRKGHAASPDRA